MRDDADNGSIIEFVQCLAAMRPVQTHRYLEEERAIPRELLGNPCFEGRILVDAHSNAVAAAAGDRHAR